MGRSANKLAAARTQIGEIASTMALDVTDETAVAAAFSEIDEPDHLVTAAAGTYLGRISA
ncbi:MAG: hypothetical protein ACERJ2_10700 [Filomicrobium sp.]